MKSNMIKRIIVTTVLFASLLTFNPFRAIPFIGFTSDVHAAVAPTDEPQADVINWVYRKYNGWLQKRRWNFTKGYWVDPNWITLKKI